MGLLGAIYEFDGAIPPLDAIEKRIRELYPEVLVTEGTLDPAEEDERNSQPARPLGNTVLMRSTHATLRVASDPPKWSRWVDLGVSVDGTKLGLDSNNRGLLQSVCDAVASLGGRIHRKSQNSASKPGMALEELNLETQAAIERAEEQADRGEGIPAGEAFRKLRRKHFGQ